VHPDGKDLVDRPILTRWSKPSVGEPASNRVQCDSQIAQHSNQALIVTAWLCVQAHRTCRMLVAQWHYVYLATSLADARPCKTSSV
jgi:hypothetical protein